MKLAQKIIAQYSINESRKVLGYTESGKKVYNEFKAGLYKDFTEKDHLDAAQILGRESYKLSQFQMKDKDALASEYSKYAMMHTNQYKAASVGKNDAKEEEMLPYGYKTYSGKKLADQQVDAYNEQTKKINQYLKQGRKPPEELLNGRHNLLRSFSEAVDKKEINSILTALNSTNDLGFKYPIGNKELTNKVKYLEQQGLIYYDDKFGKWKKK